MSACNPPDRRGAAGDGETRAAGAVGGGMDGPRAGAESPPGPGEKAWDGVGKMESSVPRCGVVCVSRSRFLGKGGVRAGEDSTLATKRLGLLELLQTLWMKPKLFTPRISARPALSNQDRLSPDFPFRLCVTHF